MLSPVDQSSPAATAEAARLYVLAVIYAALGALAWLATGRRLARTSKEI
ncbi:MAG: hypothetical protein HOY79_49995 [Streptomyces sp.]|nr:hypothetical protein [Streptomyces sp.]